ncbi:hypothetical protein [Nonomuraea sp. NPDC050783]|uniref:hypothetical protein n=1 Tax=Nonomuraea sp. NPDC050783 TaxID=3154634 RepID=UPI00346737BC
MMTPDGWTIASSSQGNCVGARRVVRSREIQVCETDNPGHIIQVTEHAWDSFLMAIKADAYEPERDGNAVVFTVDDPIRRRSPSVETTDTNWNLFVAGVKAGKFDKLPPVPLGLAVGQWETGEYLSSAKTG